jgi:hypothetical protein
MTTPSEYQAAITELVEALEKVVNGYQIDSWATADAIENLPALIAKHKPQGNTHIITHSHALPPFGELK